MRLTTQRKSWEEERRLTPDAPLFRSTVQYLMRCWQRGASPGLVTMASKRTKESSDLLFTHWTWNPADRLAHESRNHFNDLIVVIENHIRHFASSTSLYPHGSCTPLMQGIDQILTWNRVPDKRCPVFHNIPYHY